MFWETLTPTEGPIARCQTHPFVFHSSVPPQLAKVLRSDFDSRKVIVEIARLQHCPQDIAIGAETRVTFIDIGMEMSQVRPEVDYLRLCFNLISKKA